MSDQGEQEPRVDRPGAVTYLHIPAADPSHTAAFYAQAFGWTIRDPDSESPAFRDGSGHVIGHFVKDQEVTGPDGVRPYIYVEDVTIALQQVLDAGGRVLIEPFAEGSLTVAIFEDPAGNVLGVWQFGTAA